MINDVTDLEMGDDYEIIKKIEPKNSIILESIKERGPKRHGDTLP